VGGDGAIFLARAHRRPHPARLAIAREWAFPAASRSGHVEEIKGSSWVNGTSGDKRKIVQRAKSVSALSRRRSPSRKAKTATTLAEVNHGSVARRYRP